MNVSKRMKQVLNREFQWNAPDFDLRPESCKEVHFITQILGRGAEGPQA